MQPTLTTIRQLPAHIGSEVVLRGWVYNIRSSGKLRFLQMRDGSGIVQIVWFKGSVDETTFAKLDTLTQETSIIVTGRVKAEARAEGGVELDGKLLEVVQVAVDYPIGPKEHGPDFLLSNRHLWLRSRKPHAILRIRDRFVKAVRDFFDQEGFTLVDTPIFTPAACEGTT
ncbi:asparagine--tRNA ligase, partial [bacterium]|nr:asparagine--tRNA ligase [bacterium]